MCNMGLYSATCQKCKARQGTNKSSKEGICNLRCSATDARSMKHWKVPEFELLPFVTTADGHRREPESEGAAMPKQRCSSRPAAGAGGIYLPRILLHFVQTNFRASSNYYLLPLPYSNAVCSSNFLFCLSVCLVVCCSVTRGGVQWEVGSKNKPALQIAVT